MPEPIWSKSFAAHQEEILVIQCSDGRFTDAMYEFLHDQGIKNYDLIAVPGSIQFLVAKTFPKFIWVARHWIKFLLKHHSINRVIVFSHQDCGWYKFWNAAETFTEKIFRMQQADVQEIPGILQDISHHKEILFEHYFIHFTEERIFIEKK